MIALLLALTLQDPAATEIGLSACGEGAAEVVRDESLSLPAAGEERSADVGDPLLVDRRFVVRNTGSSLAGEVVVSGTTSRAPFTLTIPAGTRMILEGPGYRPHDYTFEGRGGRPTEVHFETAAATPVARMSWGFWKERHPITAGNLEMTRGECYWAPPNSLMRQLAFTGVSRGVVSIEYREFSGDLARPAFTQTATYDLAEGRVIGFRGARIEILTADNLGVRYRVQKGFD